MEWICRVTGKEGENEEISRGEIKQTKIVEIERPKKRDKRNGALPCPARGRRSAAPADEGGEGEQEGKAAGSGLLEGPERFIWIFCGPGIIIIGELFILWTRIFWTQTMWLFEVCRRQGMGKIKQRQ